ncbi:MAG: Glycosyl transferase, family 39 [Berkelbacteria bacterium GW2011_GWB1_38_5]|uniref:Glycosyl transferase, family 39 n=2 Tax=Candidatus Berkelbacteria TaxID=1618330 RepID=A0A0G0IRT3_9BACT|nr:MAG: Glycosyl transferase, family 39 [Berkelbacteria bacterium GW2011_GWA1_36_9]KKQ73843.1 MAG: Glycosyl transferase, family 39 [Berkelbacteria bacterium GW2011_GWB1_38_5]
MFKKNKTKILLIAIMLASFVLMFFSAQSDSLTNDEKVHITAGYLHTWKGDYTFNTEHPPLLNDLAGLFAKFAKPNLPEKPLSSFNSGSDQWEFADLFFYNSQNNVDKIILFSRLPFIFLTLCLIYLVFLLAKTLFGVKAGLIAATLTAFSPNILAHGRLATTDIGLVFFFLLTCWLLRKYFLKPNWQNALFLGLSLGLVILAKFSGVIILPVIFLGLIYIWKTKKPKFLSAFGQFLIILILPIILIWVFYAFSMRANLDNSLLMMPFEKFVAGLKTVMDHNNQGHLTYLNGQLSSTGWWYYFPLVLWYKMTLSELILLVVSIIVLSLRAKRSNLYQIDCFVADAPRNDKHIDKFNYYLIIFPPLLFLVVSMIGHIDIGIRHVLVLLPFFYIFISQLINYQNRYLKFVLLVLLVGQIVICILAFPNYIAYFNQIAGGSKGGIKHLADSNLDWDQNIKRFKKYVEENKVEKVYQDFYDGNPLNYYGINYNDVPKKPTNGMVAISAQWLVVPRDRFDIDWVKNYPPDDIISNGIYIWRFDKKPVELR